MHQEQSPAEEMAPQGTRHSAASDHPGDFAPQAQTQSSEANPMEGADGPADQQPAIMLEQFPPEIATLLIMAGAAGVLLPGPVGTPLLIAGGVILWPRTFRPIERWFSRRFPAMHREGVIQLKVFIRNLERRFPDSRSESK